MRTYSPRPNEVASAWWLVDAQDVVLGRLATQVAHVLRGKHKPTFAPHVDVGDHVVIVNAAGVKLTGAKAVQSLRHRHSGYPGGLRSISFGRLLEESPEKLVEQAVKGMPAVQLGEPHPDPQAQGVRRARPSPRCPVTAAAASAVRGAAEDRLRRPSR